MHAGPPQNGLTRQLGWIAHEDRLRDRWLDSQVPIERRAIETEIVKAQQVWLIHGDTRPILREFWSQLRDDPAPA